MPILLFAMSGILMGGTWSMRRQGAGRSLVVVMGALAVLALVGGILWLLPGRA